MFDKDQALPTLDLCFEMESPGGSIALEDEVDFDERHGSTGP